MARSTSTRTAASRTATRAALGPATVALLLAALAACSAGPSPSPSPSTGSAPAASATADAAPVDVPSLGSAPADCTTPGPVVAAAKGFAEVTGVQLIGGCGQVSVETSLPPGSLGTPSATTATAICNAVSRVAYVGSVYGVSVDGQDGHELAAGVKDHPDCVPG